jgi:hypothetical protein
MAPGRPIPNSDPEGPPERRGRGDQQQPEEFSGLPAVRGLPGVRRDQTAEPPVFVDARSLRIVGRDQRGKEMFGMTRRLPQSQPDGHLEQTGDRLYDLVEGFANNHVSVLGRYQQMLDQHYRARR